MKKIIVIFWTDIKNLYLVQTKIYAGGIRWKIRRKWTGCGVGISS